MWRSCLPPIGTTPIHLASRYLFEPLRSTKPSTKELGLRIEVRCSRGPPLNPPGPRTRMSRWSMPQLRGQDDHPQSQESSPIDPTSATDGLTALKVYSPLPVGALAASPEFFDRPSEGPRALWGNHSFSEVILHINREVTHQNQGLSWSDPMSATRCRIPSNRCGWDDVAEVAAGPRQSRRGSNWRTSVRTASARNP